MVYTHKMAFQVNAATLERFLCNIARENPKNQPCKFEIAQENSN